jgi:hypothetical protein
MKKQGVSKLVLSRETVRVLDDQLRGVGGGFTNITCYDSCPTAVVSLCPSCPKTGGC